MDELLKLLTEADDNEDTIIRFVNAAWSGETLDLQLSVSTDNSDSSLWQIRCEQVLDYALVSAHHENLEFHSDHPLLWRFHYDHASAFFSGAPLDADAAVGALYREHQTSIGDWFSLEANLNNAMPLAVLLKAGNGLLGDGPIPLLTIYSDVLKAFGVEVQIVSRYPPGGRMSKLNQQNDLKNECKVLLIGESYVTGIGWTAKPLAQKSEMVSKP